MTDGGHTGDKFSNNRGGWHALVLFNMNQVHFQ
jgi:hypothetical protein